MAIACSVTVHLSCTLQGCSMSLSDELRVQDAAADSNPDPMSRDSLQALILSIQVCFTCHYSGLLWFPETVTVLQAAWPTR